MHTSSQTRLMKLLIVLATTCVLIVSLVWASTIAMQPSTESRSFAKALGMSVYCAKDPFSVSVKSRKSPSDGFVFAAHDQQFILGDGPTDEAGSNADLRNIQLTLGHDFSISCIYRPAVAGDVRQLKLMLRDYGFIDLNVDGQWDMRIQYPPNTRVEVLLQNVWREVTIGDGSEFRRKLLDGRYVLFDRRIGTWASDE